MNSADDAIPHNPPQDVRSNNWASAASQGNWPQVKIVNLASGRPIRTRVDSQRRSVHTRTSLVAWGKSVTADTPAISSINALGSECPLAMPWRHVSIYLPTEVEQAQPVDRAYTR